MKPAPRVTPKTDEDLRRRELAQIHIAKKDTGMAEDTYRSVIRHISKGRTDSAGSLDFTERKRLLEHLRACGFKPGSKPASKRPRAPYPGRPHQIDSSAPTAAQLGKVEALLADAGRAWAYADGMAKRMFDKDRVAFCNGAELQKLIASLSYDKARRQARPANPKGAP